MSEGFGWLIFIAILISMGIVYIIIEFWYILLSLIALAIFIVFASVITIDLLTNRKINKIQKSDVILIPSTTLYSIPIEVIKKSSTNQNTENQWIVVSVRPELNHDIVDFVPLEHNLNKVEIPTSKDAEHQSFKTAKSISYLTQEIYQRMNPKIDAAKEQIEQLRGGKTLALSSTIYQAKAEIYANKINQFKSFIEQTEILKEKYAHFIRESLIGAELSKFNLEAQSNDLEYQVKLHTEFEMLSEKYEDLKNEIDAYVDLSENKPML